MCSQLRLVKFCLSAVVAFETMKYEFGERGRSGRLRQDRAITPLLDTLGPSTEIRMPAISDANVDEPGPAIGGPAGIGRAFGRHPFTQALLAGLLIGLLDINCADGGGWILSLYLIAGISLGLRHAGRAWLCWPPLGGSLYPVHVAAILLGRKQPYVEADVHIAVATLGMLFPVGIGLACGAATRRALAGLGWFERKGAPPIRLLPQTTRGWLAAVALIAVAIGFMRWFTFDSGTRYSAGYSERAFQQLRIGMTSAQIESALGSPLRKVDWSGDGAQNWMFSNQVSPTSDYWRRWVFIKDGKVIDLVSDYWWD
jgi:hypothetical protein